MLTGGPAVVISKFAFGITYFLSLIAGLIIALESWVLQVILSISMDLVNSAPVRVGFPIVLSIANLFFVGALIVIAIATILRREEYGAKNVLWKLVVMAIMVNFGLVICGTLLSISDETTKFFIESVSPGSSGPNGETNFRKFSESIAGAFNPQAVILTQKDITENPAIAQEAISGAAQAGDNFGDMLKPLISIMSTIGSFIVIIITLTTLIGMLLWRYIRLGMAMIVLPLAWAAWIFPTYQEHYKKWWTKFTQWAIFPPVVVFFLWLGLKISEVMSQQTGEFAEIYPDGGENAVAAFLGGTFTPIISQTLKSFILFGIMMGGMVAAQELGVKFADGGYKAIEGAGGWAKGKAMNYTKRGARATYQKVGGRLLNQKLADNKWGQGRGRLLKPILTTLGSGAASLGRGMGAATQAGGSDVVDDYKKGVPHDTAGKISRLEGNNNMPEILAILSSLKADELSKVKKIGGAPLWKWLEDNHQKIEDYGQHDLEKNLKDMGASHGLLSALDGHGNLQEAVTAAMKDGDSKVLSKLMKNGAGLGLEEGGAQQKALQEAIIRGIKDAFVPEDIANFTSKMNAEQMANFKGAMKKVVHNAQEANDILGEDQADYFRKNGIMISRGFGSKVLWGEAEKKQPGTDGDIASRDEVDPNGRRANEKTTHKAETSAAGGGHAAPAAKTSTAPAAKSAGGHGAH